jgi:hypothetical protein
MIAACVDMPVRLQCCFSSRPCSSVSRILACFPLIACGLLSSVCVMPQPPFMSSRTRSHRALPMLPGLSSSMCAVHPCQLCPTFSAWWSACRQNACSSAMVVLLPAVSMCRVCNAKSMCDFLPKFLPPPFFATFFDDFEASFFCAHTFKIDLAKGREELTRAGGDKAGQGEGEEAGAISQEGEARR